MLRRFLFMPFFCACAIGSSAQLTLLDPTFGEDGLVLLGLSGSGGDFGEDVALQADGRIVAVGRRGGTDGTLVALRLLDNGSLDPSFSGNGIATVDIATNAQAQAVAIQNDGRIVAAGSAEFQGGSWDDLAFVRLTSDGELDTTFSGDGKFTIEQPGGIDAVLALALQPDGRILGAGKFEWIESDMVAVRLTAGGALDNTFATGGIFNSDLQTGEVAEDIVLRSNGSIVLAGAWHLHLPDAGLALVQLDANGAMDPAFGTGGLFWPLEEGSTSAVASAIELSDGRILLAGRRYLAGGTLEEVFTGRVLPDGQWDESYGNGGRSFLPVTSGYTGAVRDMVLLPSGKALLAVDALDAQGNGSIIAMRVMPDGGLDPTFGTDGRVLMPCPNADCHVRSIALDGLGRVVGVGGYNTTHGTEVMIVRWLAEASPVGQVEVEARETFRVYPVPASDALQLDVPREWLADARLELMDACGRLVTVFNGTGGSSHRIELPASLADGRYLLRLVSASRVLSAPVVVLR
jgi:uncharacterized delta-60 repeat protein